MGSSERAKLFIRAETEKIGISVMKPFHGGQLLSDNTSPFRKELTKNQCIQYCLDRSAVLAVFALVSGLFSKKIVENGWYAFPAVLLAQVSGRATFMLLVLAFRSLVPFTPEVIWSQIQTELLALVLQAVIVPFIVMGLILLLLKDKEND